MRCGLTRDRPFSKNEKINHLMNFQLRKVEFRVFYAASEMMSIEVKEVITFEWQQERELL